MASSAVVSAIKASDTPYSAHLSSVFSSGDPELSGTIDQLQRLKPYIEFDLESTREVGLDYVLVSLAKLDLESLRGDDQEVDPKVVEGTLKTLMNSKDVVDAAANSDVLSLRDAYCAKTNGTLLYNKEKARYGPFVELANKILELLCGTKAIPIAFCKNEPHPLGGVLKNARTPDVVVLDGSHESVKNGRWAEYSKQVSGTSQDTRYTWADVLFAVEFKLKDDPIRIVQPSDAQPEPAQRSNSPFPTSDRMGEAVSESSTLGACLPVTDAHAPMEAGPSSSARMPSRRKSKLGLPLTRSNSSGRGKTNRKVKQGVPVASSRPMSAPDGVFEELVPSTGSKRPSKSEAGSDRSKRSRRGGYTGIFFRELCEQGLRYAIEQLSYSQNLRHVFNLVVIDEKLWICYYDHTGIIRASQRLDFANDLPRFVLLLKCLKDMSKSEYGILKRITRNKDHNATQGSVSDDDAGANASSSVVKKANRKGAAPEGPDFMTQFSLSIEGLVFRFIGRLAVTRFFGLLGRACGVFMAKLDEEEGTAEVTCKPGMGKVFAVKLSWPAKSRISEVRIINEGRRMMKELDDDAEFRKENHIDGNLVDCLPVIHSSEDLDDLVETKGCFRQRLNVLKFLDGVENRVLRAIAFELLIPIYKLGSPEKFKKCFRGIFQGHHFLWFKGVKHRDISIGNLMCRCVGDEVYGVLNDWDLSKLEGSKEPTSISRTGTRPFMARDLLLDELQDHPELQDPKLEGHLERYDWESMLYVLIWIGCRYDATGKEANKNVLQEWFKHDLKTLAAYKATILEGGIPPFNEHYRGLNGWVLALRKLFYVGYGYKKEYLLARRMAAEGTLIQLDLSKPYVNETLGGHVTYKKLLEIFKS
ncbi:hypothetical protein M0805_006009 [Coniferiporia weirii]|nr:hypothetical protein M0805_006009 [Coniferiporia weirii]